MTRDVNDEPKPHLRVTLVGPKTSLRVTASLLILSLSCFSPTAADDNVWSALKKGGYVVLLAHASAGPGGDPLRLDLGDCAAERNLSSEGKKEAQQLGQEFIKRNIPVADVLSSRYCRAQDTARLAFGRATPLEPLDLIEGEPEAVIAARTEAITKRISAFKGPGNLILVSHRPNIMVMTLEMIDPGGFLVLKPTSDGFDMVGRFGGFR